MQRRLGQGTTSSCANASGLHGSRGSHRIDLGGNKGINNRIPARFKAGRAQCEAFLEVWSGKPQLIDSPKGKQTKAQGTE